jgi:hypothetical protein
VRYSKRTGRDQIALRSYGVHCPHLHATEAQTSQPLLGARRDKQAQGYGNHSDASALACALFPDHLILGQKIRFWKVSGLLVAVFVVYIIYLNVVGFHLGASKQHAAEFALHRQQKFQPAAETEQKPQHTHFSEKPQHEAETSQKPQKTHFSGTPEKMKAVVLKSIPHDTGAFTQVSARHVSCSRHF